jgi:hypothetical protein
MLFGSAKYTERMSRPDNYKDQRRTLRTSPRWYIARRQKGRKCKKSTPDWQRGNNGQQGRGQMREDSPFNQVQTRGSCDYMANLARLQSKCSVFKLLLHVALGKETAEDMVSGWDASKTMQRDIQVASLPGAAAIALGGSQVAKAGCAASDPGFMAEDNGHGIVLGAGDLGLAPTRGTARVSVLDEQMRCADLALLLALAVGSQAGRAVVGAHVMLEGLAIGAGRRLPSALLGRGVEIVGKVLGVGVSNLPAARKTGSLESWSCQRQARERE